MKLKDVGNNNSESTPADWMSYVKYYVKYTLKLTTYLYNYIFIVKCKLHKTL